MNCVFRLYLLSLAWLTAVGVRGQFVPLEKLDRGVVVLPANDGEGCFVGWRFLASDGENTCFDVLRDGQVIAKGLKGSTCFNDPKGVPSSTYQIVTRTDDNVLEKSEVVQSWENVFLSIRLDRPGNQYTPNDCSVGDVDGDGQYDLFVKWNPRNAKDNSHKGMTDLVLLDCYRLDGTRLWRIDLGRNIRAGAHYTQFLVYDFDGDGRAEMICKTAPGSKDGAGRYVTDAATDPSIRNATDNEVDYRNQNGYVLDGAEYLTVFDGLTGKAIHTIYYQPNRAGGVGGDPSGSDQRFWGDSYGGRCDRFLACAAHLDGLNHPASAVMGRGYYTKAFLWAVDFDGKQLSTRWLHASLSPRSVNVTDCDGKTTAYTYSQSTSGGGSATLFGNGNHNLSVADVDGDGKDEIIYGSAAIDHDGTLLYATGFGHGDAIHLSNLLPDRLGLEVFQVHEGRGQYSYDLHDAATGEIIYRGGNKGVDNGRGLAADVLSSHRGFEFWSADERQIRSSVNGEKVYDFTPSINFRIYWDGDLYDELLDNKRITDVTDHGIDTLVNFADMGRATDCNGSKHTPCLQADLFGDWREEVIFFDREDPSRLLVFTTNIPTAYRIPTLMHNPVYRLAIVWQNTAYNQPPHLGFYLPDYSF